MLRVGSFDRRMDRTMRPATSPDAALRVPGWEVAALSALVVFYMANGALFGADGSVFANTVGPLWLSAALGVSAIRSVFVDRAALWTALFWARLTTVIYFGLGSVAGTVMNEDTLSAVHAFYMPSEAEVAKFNLVVASGVLCFLVAARATRAVMPASLHTHLSPPRNGRLLATGLLFALIGFGVRYLIMVPRAVGMLGDVVVPGVVVYLALFAPVSLFLLTVWATRNSRPALILIVAAGLLDSFVGVLTFAKFDALLPLMMLMLALLHHRVSVARLLFVAMVGVFAFKTLQPAVGYGRDMLSVQYGSIGQGSLGERLQILAAYARGERGGVEETGYQGSLARISYIYAATPAVTFYDTGQPGDSLGNLVWLLVPRILWPEKPVFEGGARYTAMINGSDSSSTGMGYYAEAYWNLGWLGVPIVMVPFGIVLLLTGRYALWAVREEQWLHFPLVFLAMKSGWRTDGDVTSDIGFAVVVLLLAYPLVRVATVFLDSVVEPGGASARRTQAINPYASPRRHR